MEELIKQVQEYFKEKLLSGDFKIVKVDEYREWIQIDEKYNFCIWMRNNAKFRRIYESEYNFMHIDLNDEERATLAFLVDKGYADYIKNEAIQKKLEEIERMKAEFEIS